MLTVEYAVRKGNVGDGGVGLNVAYGEVEPTIRGGPEADLLGLKGELARYKVSPRFPPCSGRIVPNFSNPRRAGRRPRLFAEEST